jgi:hypothetical protein
MVYGLENVSGFNKPIYSFKMCLQKTNLPVLYTYTQAIPVLLD